MTVRLGNAVLIAVQFTAKLCFQYVSHCETYKPRSVLYGIDTGRNLFNKFSNRHNYGDPILK